VDAVMASFVDQPGVPLVSASLTCTGSTGAVSLAQERYIADSGASAGPQAWRIPVCVRTSSGATACDVLAQRTATLPLGSCAAWVMPNAGARGYYRTSYSPESVRDLAAGVEKLSPAERVAVLSDEWALVRAGRHGVGSYLDLASGFAGERSAPVMATLTRTLDTIGEELTSPATAPAYRAWVAALLRPVAREVGWKSSDDEGEDRAALRASVVATLGGTGRDPEVLTTAADLVRQELDRPGSIEPALLNVVVSLAAIRGDASLYERYLARSQKARDPEDRYRYLYALAAFPVPPLVRRTMDYALGPEVRTQDTKSLISRMLVNPDSGTLAWQLLQKRWGDLRKKTGDSGNDALIVGALQAFCDTTVASQARRFFGAHRVPDAARTLQQSIERITSCARLAAVQRPKLAEWLKRSQPRSFPIS
jgi:aminopeptidase N